MIRRFSDRSSFSSLLVLAILSVSVVYVRCAAAGDQQDVLLTLERYIRATYARDYEEAYSYIASGDQRLKDRRSYVQDRGAFRGFTLDVARKLASYIELSPIEKQFGSGRASIKVKAKVPDAAKLASVLHNWDSDRLDALSDAERKATVETIEKLHRDRKLDMVEGEDAFELVKENSAWKIILNWSAGVKVNFQASVSSTVPVEAHILRSEVTSRPGEIFKVAFRIKNTGKGQVYARIGHLVDPHEFRDYLDLVECGFLLPVRLPPGTEEEFTSTYLLRGNFPEGVRHLSVTYAVTLAQ